MVAFLTRGGKSGLTRLRTWPALALLALLLLAVAAAGQKLNPAQWSLGIEPARAAPGSEVLGRLEVRLDPGWHLYSLTTPRPPIATTITLAGDAPSPALKIYAPAPIRKFDPNFGVQTETYEGYAVFLLRIHLKPDAPAGTLDIAAQVRYQLCDDKQCLPPVRRTAAATITVDPLAKVAAPAIPAGYTEVLPKAASPTPAKPAGGQTGAQPMPAGVQAGPRPQLAGDQGLLRFLLVAVGFGLAAVFTPCVFPMIPITMSFFLNRPGGGRGAVAQASVFCLGIIVLFSLLGLAATAALGPFGVVLLGSNPWVNSFIAIVFFAFSLSLLGAFEITLPSGLLTRLDRASGRGGFAGTLLMGLTFSLTSFACVGPFVGTLLAASVAGGGWQPLAGMAAFATGLAAPFFLLAIFPSYLQRMPRSGGWLARVKVMLGFLILAAMLKYLSNVDQVMQWNLLTRERFLAAWVVLFSLAGLYLLGFLRMEGVTPGDPLGVGRLLAGALLLVFAVSLIPGMFGARLGELDAYVPPGRGAASSEPSASWMKNQFREALERARAEGKPVLVAFTGYACTNCHWMKANLFPRPEIAARLRDFVLVELYSDGADQASEQNQKLQETRFSTIAIPYYAVLNADEKVLGTFAGLTRNPSEFLAFLDSAR
ncbi:MAG: cytochrome c biogenesis protein CcdA [Bryobacterales bacterium]|nr:cytochrome c biogenesis protein CcdA [Bryobacterales bacterium]